MSTLLSRVRSHAIHTNTNTHISGTMNVVVSHGVSVQTVLLFWDGITCVLETGRGRTREEEGAKTVSAGLWLSSSGSKMDIDACFVHHSGSHTQTTTTMVATRKRSKGGKEKCKAHRTPQRALQPWVLGSKAGSRHVSAPWRVATFISSARRREVCVCAPQAHSHSNQSESTIQKERKPEKKKTTLREQGARCSEVKQINKCCASQIGQLKHGLVSFHRRTASSHRSSLTLSAASLPRLPNCRASTSATR